ncbi:hypothetical protein T11_5322 [Trichinella zimbabwensis]|uniref:Uncharacterized protein n=1 Tax=Trichinella zimbabwensis TaxID=268475 RepID=A0A0V1HDI1_9BILA|nr:hypothetical protein T11_5322 [Trichinella zimbabwensis]
MDFAVLGTQKSSFAILAFSYKHRFVSIGESVVQRNRRIFNFLQTQPIQLRCSKGNSLGIAVKESFKIECLDRYSLHLGDGIYRHLQTILINFMELFSNLQEVDIAGPIY